MFRRLLAGCLTKPDRSPTFIKSLAGDRTKGDEMFGSDTRRELAATRSVVEALTETNAQLIDRATRAIEAGDKSIRLAEEAAQIAANWRERAFEALLQAEITGELLTEAENDVTDTSFVLGVLLQVAQEFLSAAPATSKRDGYTASRNRLFDLVRALDERDRDAVDALLADFEPVPEGERESEPEVPADTPSEGE